MLAKIFRYLLKLASIPASVAGKPTGYVSRNSQHLDNDDADAVGGGSQAGSDSTIGEEEECRPTLVWPGSE